MLTEEERKILLEAKEFISIPENWTCRSFARNSLGEKCYYPDEGAVAFCAIGYLLKRQKELSADNFPNSLFEKLTAASKKLFTEEAKSIGLPKDFSIVDVNDFLGREAILKLYDYLLEAS